MKYKRIQKDFMLGVVEKVHGKNSSIVKSHKRLLKTYRKHEKYKKILEVKWAIEREERMIK